MRCCPAMCPGCHFNRQARLDIATPECAQRRCLPDGNVACPSVSSVPLKVFDELVSSLLQKLGKQMLTKRVADPSLNLANTLACVVTSVLVNICAVILVSCYCHNRLLFHRWQKVPRAKKKGHFCLGDKPSCCSEVLRRHVRRGGAYKECNHFNPYIRARLRGQT